MRNILLVVVLLWTTTIALADGRKTQQLLQDLKNVSTPQEKAELLNVLTQHYWETDPSQSVAYGLKAAAFCKEQGFQQQLATSYNNISVGYYWLNNLPKATEFALKALKLREKLKDTLGLASSHNNLGNIYRDQKRYKEALSAFNRALAIGKKLKNHRILVSSLSNIGTIYEVQKHSKKALEYYLQVNALNKATGDEYELAIDHYNIGNLYTEMGDFDQSLSHLNLSLNYSHRTNNKVNEMYVLRGLAKLYLRKNQLDKAQELAMESLTISQEVKSPEGVKEAASLLNNIYTAKKDYQKAHRYLTLYTQKQDSLSSETQAQALAEVNTKYKTDKDQIEIQKLKAEHALHSEKLAQKTKTQYSIGILLFLVASLAAVFFRGRTKVQAANRQLSAYNQLILEKNASIQEQANALTSQAALLQNQKEELENLNQVKDRLFSIVAHDLRGPLISLQSLLQIMTMGNLPPDVMARFMQDVNAQQQNTLGLLDNLLLWAKLQMKGLQLEPQPLQLQALVDQTILLLLPQAQKKAILLENQIKTDQWVYTDAETLKLVFRNLMSNAIKFCVEGDLVVITASVTAAGICQVTVKDTGKGISPENQQKLFGPNHYKELGTANEKGNGLGLMLCKEFVEKNGGTIWVDSQVGDGSQFHFTILACDIPVMPAPRHSRKQASWA
ncbi:tetratricopeptide repeat protein [Nibribacter ruber]|uniref:histidine kinase n=1 Tax=Nibribacter ruber TaxID=2698458 RepID=A0A6P1NVE1_9BACT|nr:tetratricopeptide repeat protein [Nibribacter ruber]QHL86239.1 tetratricopeptide repeat protein [Nibribacter ruber]